MQPLRVCLLQQQQQLQLLVLLLGALASFFPLSNSFQLSATLSPLTQSPLWCPYTSAKLPHAKAPTPAPLLLQRDAYSSRRVWVAALSTPSPRASAVCSAAANSAAAAAGEVGGASSSSSSSSSSSKCLSLPLWSRIFSRRFLFSDHLPSALSPLHAALFAEATKASRVVEVWGLSDLLRPAHAERRGAAAAAAGLAAAAAACLAAFASWRLLGLAARAFRKLTTQHRLAENRIYGPLHSLDATIKPLEAEPRATRQNHRAQSAKQPPTSNSNSSSSDRRSSSSSSSNSDSKKHPLAYEEISSSKTDTARRATARGPRVSSTDNNSSGSSSSKETDGSSSSSRKKKRGMPAPAEIAPGSKEGEPGRKRRRGAQTQQAALAAGKDAVSDGLDESAGQLPPEAT